MVDETDDSTLELRPGPFTHVAISHEATAERICDLDGDGLLDSAIAELGGTQGQIFLLTLNAIIGDPRESFNRILVHFPWVDDLDRFDDSETTVIIAQGFDMDEPRNAEDDFSGEERFEVRGLTLDPCGEPLDVFPNARLAGGELETSTPGRVSIAMGLESLPTRGARLFGYIEADGSEAEWTSCGYVSIQDFGASSVPEIGVGELSFLEVILAGGSALGVPTLPGLNPDLDLDGDGLERFQLGDDNLLERCIDGDLTPIDGRDCWQDERMADAFAINLRLLTVPAQLGPLEAGWEELVEGECTDPPEASLWDAR